MLGTTFNDSEYTKITNEWPSKDYEEQTIIAEHAEEMTHRFCAFRSLILEIQFIIASVTTGLRNATSSS